MMERKSLLFIIFWQSADYNIEENFHLRILIALGEFERCEDDDEISPWYFYLHFWVEIIILIVMRHVWSVLWKLRIIMEVVFEI